MWASVGPVTAWELTFLEGSPLWCLFCACVDSTITALRKCICRVIFITLNNKDNFCYFYSPSSAKMIVNIMEMQRFHFFWQSFMPINRLAELIDLLTTFKIKECSAQRLRGNNFADCHLICNSLSTCYTWQVAFHHEHCLTVNRILMISFWMTSSSFETAWGIDIIILSKYALITLNYQAWSHAFECRRNYTI